MNQASAHERAELTKLILSSLRKQGFRIRNRQIVPPKEDDKTELRNRHRLSVQHRIEHARDRLAQHEDRLLRYIASGDDIDPIKIRPQLVEVRPKAEEELLFRYCSLHWSVPISSGYGRRLRFVVFDEQNGKVMGLFGLCDPVFSVAGRDDWVGWSFQARRQRLKHVMEAFILGAIPPYSHLLCGKLMAMLCGSDEVRAAFKRKYGKGQSVIRHKRADGRLALIATTSALGKSSIYNRLRLRDRPLMYSVGFTSGWGDFHFSNGAYRKFREFAETYCKPTAKQTSWGKGFRNRREVVRKCLSYLGLSHSLQNHGIKRELFVVPLAQNAREFLRGEHQRLRWYQQPLDDLFEYFRARWLLPRAQRDTRFQNFDRESYRLW